MSSTARRWRNAPRARGVSIVHAMSRSHAGIGAASVPFPSQPAQPVASTNPTGGTSVSFGNVTVNVPPGIDPDAIIASRENAAPVGPRCAVVASTTLLYLSCSICSDSSAALVLSLCGPLAFNTFP